MSTPDAQRAINRGAAIVVPCLLVITGGIATYVVVVRLCVNYLLNPSTDLRLAGVYPRNATAIALIVVHSVLLALMSITYLRILQVINTNPGYIRKGPHAQPDHATHSNTEKQTFQRSCAPTTVEEGPRKHRSRSRSHSRNSERSSGFRDLNRKAILDGTVAPPPGLERFYAKDAFVCDMSGLPIFCPKCDNWKRDRTHHCSEVGRCVRRMDHFCPWVGGVVSETNMKFFLQFVVYAALYTLFVLVVLAVFVAEQVRMSLGRDTWSIAILACSAIFFFFAAGMSGSVIQMSLRNYTTVENLFKGGKTYFIAVYVPPQPPSPHPTIYPTITYPLRPTPGADIRQFAILQTKPGENPWDLTPGGNMRELMGYNWLDWLLPIRYSPFCRHGAGSEYPFGPVLDRMKREAGLDRR